VIGAVAPTEEPVPEEREYLFTSGGLKEALRGFDFSRAVEVLQEEGVMPSREGGKNSISRKIDGSSRRVYPVRADVLLRACDRV
jgi:putative DNA primase/helicase